MLQERLNSIGLSVLGLVFVLVSLLILFLVPVLWPFGILTGVIALGSLGLTLFYLKLEIDAKKESLERAWDGKFGSEAHGITELLNTLTKEDITLLQKVNSEEWRNNFTNADAEIQEVVKQKRENASREAASYVPPLSPDGPPAVEKIQDNNPELNKENASDLRK